MSSPIYQPIEGTALGYDIIGDVHGCAKSLAQLLTKLGYTKRKGVYFHPSRQVIFLGDIIDRGPRIREALHMVFDMVERGNALMILGNHELNAIAFATPVKRGANEYLRAHTPTNIRHMQETFDQFSRYPNEWVAFVKWFLSLPLFLEIIHPKTQQIFRAVHACWEQSAIEAHRARYGGGHIDRSFLRKSAVPGSVEWNVRQRLTVGVDFPLPNGQTMVSSDGVTRSRFRSKFWEENASTYGDLVFQPDPLPEALAKRPIADEHRAAIVTYGVDQPPLFIGHYWLRGTPQPLAPNIACLDYSAVKYGRLVAYRMDGEAQLQANNFVWTYVDP